MNKPKSILDFFKSQSPKISCPACGISVQKCNLNAHLDFDCASSSSKTSSYANRMLDKPCNSNFNIKSAGRSVKLENKTSNFLKKSSKLSKNSRLSLKDQRKCSKQGPGTTKDQNGKVEIEVITLDDDTSCSGDNRIAETLTSSESIKIVIPEVTEKTNKISCQLSSDNLHNSIPHAEVHVYKSEACSNVNKSSEVSITFSKAEASDIDINFQSHKIILNEYSCGTIPTDTTTNVPLEKIITSGTDIETVETIFKLKTPQDSRGEFSYDKRKSIQASITSVKTDATGFSLDFQNHDTTDTLSSNEYASEIVTVETATCISSEGNNTSCIADKKTKNLVSELAIFQTLPNNIDNINLKGSVPDDTYTSNIENSDQKLPEEFTNNLKKTQELNSFESSDIAAMLQDAERFTEDDDNVFTENSQSNQNSEYSPYYIANFKHILSTVLNEECNKILFNEEDRMFIKAFETSSDAAQKLYVRLFQRKYKWLRLNKINYPKITNDPGAVLDELIKADLVDSGLDKIDLETALDLLSLPEAKVVIKQFNFNSSGKNKSDITQMLLKHCKEHKSVFFTSGKNHISTTMLKKVKNVLGPCYRISLLPKRLFTRILMLFSLPTLSEDDDDAAGGQQQQLLTLLQVNKGEIIFPDSKVNRQTMIFIDRDELIRYEEAKQLENDIINAVESKKFDVAKELYINAKEEFEDQLLSPFVERAASLPTFLKKYTSFHVYVRCMTQGVEILQRLRQYKEAVELLQRLLDQKVFCQDYRGRWFDRMALNLEQHLKQREKALEAIKQGIKDKNVRAGHRYSLLVRALRILKTVHEKDELEKEILEAANVLEAPKVVIKGRLFPRNILGRRNVFISSSTAVDEDDITVLGVEQLAIEHYKSEGYSEGIHGEGSTFHSLYGLLFWDIIYDGNIPDAFISPYQTHPLDLNHDAFFVRREKQIMSHLEQIKKSTIEEVKEIVKSTWEAHFGQSSLVAWDRFTDGEHILGLVGCMGTDLLCGICERLARDFRFTRSGVPDLVVWNPDTLLVKIVEVKGPGDKLSSKQILWLDYLLKLGASAEVCHVEAVGSKKLKKE